MRSFCEVVSARAVASGASAGVRPGRYAASEAWVDAGEASERLSTRPFGSHTLNQASGAVMSCRRLELLAPSWAGAVGAVEARLRP